MTFEELINKAEEEIKIDRTRLSTEVLDNPLRHANYIRHVTVQKAEMRKLESELAVLTRNKHAFYNGKSQDAFDIVLDSANELKVYMDGDEDIVDLKRKISNKKERISYLESICDIFKSRGFAIKTAIDLIKFEAGER